MQLKATLLSGVNHAVKYRSLANKTTREHEREQVIQRLYATEPRTSSNTDQLTPGDHKKVTNWPELKTLLTSLDDDAYAKQAQQAAPARNDAPLSSPRLNTALSVIIQEGPLDPNTLMCEPCLTVTKDFRAGLKDENPSMMVAPLTLFPSDIPIEDGAGLDGPSLEAACFIVSLAQRTLGLSAQTASVTTNWLAKQPRTLNDPSQLLFSMLESWTPYLTPEHQLTGAGKELSFTWSLQHAHQDLAILIGHQGFAGSTVANTVIQANTPILIGQGFSVVALDDAVYMHLPLEPETFQYRNFQRENWPAFLAISLNYINAIIPPCWDGCLPINAGANNAGVFYERTTKKGGVWQSSDDQILVSRVAWDLHERFAKEVLAPLKFAEGEVIGYKDAVVWLIKNRVTPPLLPLLSII